MELGTILSLILPLFLKLLRCFVFGTERENSLLINSQVETSTVVVKPVLYSPKLMY